MSPPLKVKVEVTPREPFRGLDTCPLEFWGIVAD